MSQIDALRQDVLRQWDRLRPSGRACHGDAGAPGSRVQIMEICGTHTVALSRGGLRDLLPPELRLVSGPGCPVCVTDQSYMDQTVHLARHHPEVVIATYGDMIRVPGRLGSLEEARSAGADVRIVYAAHEAVEMAKHEPGRQVVFLGVGFETTTPATALAVLAARDAGLKNFSALTAHKLVLPAMMALLATGEVQVEGFMCPGHVSVMIGYRAYEPVVAQYGRPCVVCGFEEEQILLGIAEILRQLVEGKPAACTVYAPVTAGGNATAQEIIARTFRVTEARWRALGTIPASGLALREELAEFDAARRFALPEFESYEMLGCRCGLVICGKCLPTDCPLFGTACTPRSPIGPCMVSSEGSCAAYYKYHRH